MRNQRKVHKHEANEAKVNVSVCSQEPEERDIILSIELSTSTLLPEKEQRQRNIWAESTPLNLRISSIVELQFSYSYSSLFKCLANSSYKNSVKTLINSHMYTF
jgi:hypothetical protein